MRLTDFDVLTFDMIGTLIDFETGVLDWVRPRLLKDHPNLDDTAILEAYARAQSAVRAAEPTLLFTQRFPKIWAGIAKEYGVAVEPGDGASFAASARDWPAYPDSADALAYLKTQFRYLVVVTNGDRVGARRMATTLGSPFSAIITEEDMGVSKPNPKAFEYFIDYLAKLGVAKPRILHVAQSQYHDIGAARAIGLKCAWIYRRHGKTGYGGTQVPPAFTRPDWIALSLADLVRQYQAALDE
ncbi:MAG: HAD-IA family hydrolase [Alphaproteobacteria bacterium]